MDSPVPPKAFVEEQDADRLRVRRNTLRQVLEQCQRALELLEVSDPAGDSAEGAKVEEAIEDSLPSSASAAGYESDELCELLKSKVESPDFLEKLGSRNSAASSGASDDIASWNMITATDTWECNGDGDSESEQGGYVLVRQEDIVEGIASFMAAYLLSLKQTKDITPTHLQKALSKTFSVKKKKSKLRKAWDGSKFIYSVTSWGATAIGIYQNPVLLRAASTAFWTSCRVASKVL